MGLGRIARFGARGGLSSAARSIRPGQVPIGIDFGVSSLKLIQITGSEAPSLVAAAELMTPEDLLTDTAGRLRYQMEELPGLVKKAKFKSSRAACAIPASAMFCKHLQLAGGRDADWGSMVNQHVAHKMGCDPTALVCRHEVVNESAAGKSEVIAFAAARGLVDKLMQAVKSAKLSAVGMHAEQHAAMRGVRPGISAAEADKPESELIIDLGRETTKVCIARGERMLFARVIEFGGRHLDEAVVRQTQCTPSSALGRRLQLTSLEPAADREANAGGGAGGGTFVKAVTRQADLSEPMEILADEVGMCLRYHNAVSAKSPVTKIVFAGGEARHGAMCEELARRLRLPADVVDPLARIGRSGSERVSGVDFSEPQPGWAVAVGLCLCPTDL